jgi:hypothetical protein
MTVDRALALAEQVNPSPWGEALRVLAAEVQRLQPPSAAAAPVTAPAPVVLDEVSPKDVEVALDSLLGGLLADAQRRREAADGYRDLFATFQDAGLAGALFEAQHKMLEVAFDVAAVIEKQAQRPLTAPLWRILRALPEAMGTLRQDIEQKDGSACCADKARLVLRTYLYRELRLNVPCTLFRPSVS